MADSRSRPLLRGLCPTFLACLSVPLLFPVVSDLHAVDVAATTLVKTSLLPQESPIAVDSLTLNGTVRGALAEMTATIVLRNPNPRIMEGELEFPLPDHGTVQGYALDIGGLMIDGVIVGKDQARVILETERRARIDPGLVEHVTGNLFRTRVTPIPALGTRTMRITWTAPLLFGPGGPALRIPLPRVLLPTINLDIQIQDGGNKVPEIAGFGNVRLTHWQQGFRATASLTQLTPGEDLRIALPGYPDSMVMLEENAGETFALFSLSAPPHPNQGNRPSPTIKRYAVAWDGSASRNAASLTSEAQALANLFDKPGTVLDMVVFRNTVEPAVTCRNREELQAFLATVVYDGGTNLGQLDFRKSTAPHSQTTHWLLVSDGYSTVGNQLPACDTLPVSVLTGAADRAQSTLALIAARGGGVLVDALMGAKDAATSIDNDPISLRLHNRDGTLSQIMFLQSGQRHTALCQITGTTQQVTARWMCGGKEIHQQVLSCPAAIPGRLLAKAWAGAKANELAAEPQVDNGALLTLGRRYGIVTPGSSLLVLENLQQYLRHRVEPPASWTSMHSQFMAAVKGRQDREQALQSGHLERLVYQWNERLAWYDNKHMSSVWAKGSAPGSAPLTRETEQLTREIEQRAAPVAKAAGDVTGLSFGLAKDEANEFKRVRLAASEEGLKNKSSVNAAITVQPFLPDSPHVRALRGANTGESAYRIYLDSRAQVGLSPGFILDCAQVLFDKDRRLSARVLSNLAEMRLDDPALLRTYAWRLGQIGQIDEQVHVLRRVLGLRPEEPQSQRDLALALGERARTSGRIDDAIESLTLLRRVALRLPPGSSFLGEFEVLTAAWNRFPGLEVTAVEEYNRLYAWLEQQPTRSSFIDKVPDLDSRLRRNLDTDVRVVLAWDADATDIDLHVTEPSGELVYYGRNRSSAGGLVTPDNTQGYGPEAYLIRQAPAGTYRLSCKYFATNRQTLLGPTTVNAIVYTNWGRTSEQQQHLTLRLDHSGDQIVIGQVNIQPQQQQQQQNTTDKPASVIPMHKVAQLKLGQSRTDVVKTLGDPLREESSGQKTLVYALEGNQELRLDFAPELRRALVTFPGGERLLDM